MTTYDLLIDGWHLKHSIGRVVGCEPKRVQVDSRRLRPFADALAAEFGLDETASLDSVRWYDGRFTDGHATEWQIRRQRGFHSAMKRDGIRLRLQDLRWRDFELVGPVSDAIEHVEGTYAPPWVAPPLRRRICDHVGQRPDRGGRYEQKGVDTLLVLDLLDLATSHDAGAHVSFLITGDGDFTPAVRRALGRGNHVVLVGHRMANAAKALRGAVSRQLLVSDDDLVALRLAGGTGRR